MKRLPLMKRLTLVVGDNRTTQRKPAYELAGQIVLTTGTRVPVRVLLFCDKLTKAEQRELEASRVTLHDLEPRGHVVRMIIDEGDFERAAFKMKRPTIFVPRPPKRNGRRR